MSIDEVSQRKGRGNFVTVVSDIDQGKLLEVIDSHQQDEIIKALKIQPIEMREKVKEVSVDMWGGFPKVIAEVFPNAVLVYDRFHVMKPVNEELNKIRKQIGVPIKPTFRTSTSSIVVVCKFIAESTQFGNKNQWFSDNTFCSTD